MQRLYVGRIVHYVSFGTPGGEYQSECRAAVVTSVGDSPAQRGAGLCVLNPEGMFFKQGLIQSEGHRTGGTWHWAEHD